jgi:hypothetical protein
VLTDSHNALAGFFEGDAAGRTPSRRTRQLVRSMCMTPLGAGHGSSKLAAKNKQSCYQENDY